MNRQVPLGKDLQRTKKRSGSSSSVITRGMDLVRKMGLVNENGISHRRLSQPDMEEDYEFVPLKPSWSTQNISGKEMLPLIQETTRSYCRTLHTPTRYLPQNQAIITTNSEGVILIFNDIASMCFGIDKSFIGVSFIKTCLEEPFRNQITNMLEHRKKIFDDTQKVIICGTTIPIQKRNETKSVASLWLKEKPTENGDRVYIWIIEEIYETTLSVYVDSDCRIQRVLGTMIDIYGYQEKEIIVKITSLPSISGSITFHRLSGLIHHLNTVPAKYLFGYSVDKVVDKLNIHDLMPQMPTILSNMGTMSTANNRLCKKLLSEEDESMIYVCHRDKSKFAVNIEIKVIEDDLVNVWITYDRIDAVSKHEKNMNRTYRTRELSLQNKKKEVPLTVNKKPRVPIVRPFRISSFGAVDEAKRLFPSNYLEESKHKLSQTTSNTDNNKRHPLDDYVILDVLGQGTYGMAKLAYRKDDPFQNKLVIKDRQLGSIPMEIHILNTLQKYPHLNCCKLITSMEDEDCYFVVMELLGDGMDLFDYIELDKKMTEDEIRHIFYQIASAVKHLHTHRIVHRDIKDENVILDQKGTIHLIDFGCAAYYKKDRKFDTFTGTLEYCAPEVLKGKLYEGPPQDIWASGVLLFTLIYRENPFNNIDGILEDEFKVPFILSEESLDLVKKMLDRDIEKRIDIDQVLAHPWFHPISQEQ
ncbi:hypothetical protein CU098_007725 [Rhizopus stolonifer]|uniref:Protein kinase domain-containing protein n=1 Tax=Rhizopus stolonifer TaxID=4846 RepID=A0A367JV48_RHIST|nr:hypothetical protein CU098_007725 [Rhizopus stolonifer]